MPKRTRALSADGTVNVTFDAATFKRVRKTGRTKTSSAAAAAVSVASMDAAIDAVIQSSQSQSSVGVDDGEPVLLPASRQAEGDRRGSITTIQQLRNEIAELRDIVCKQQAQIDQLMLLGGLGSGLPRLGTANDFPGCPSGGSCWLSTGGSTVGSSRGPPGIPTVDPSVMIEMTRRGPGTSDGSTTGGGSGRVPVPGVTGDGHVPLSIEFKRSVVSAVYQDFDDHDRRARNIVVSGLSTGAAVNDQTAVAELFFREFGRIPDIVRCRRLGQPRDSLVQKLLVVLRDEDEAKAILRNAKLLRHSTDDNVRSSVFLNPDITPAESHAAYVKRCERRRRLLTLRGARALVERTSAAAINPLAITSQVASGPVLGPSSAVSVEQLRPTTVEPNVSFVPVVPDGLSTDGPAADAAAAVGGGSD